MYLLGPSDVEHDPYAKELFPNGEVLYFGKNTPILFDIQTDTFADLLNRIPRDVQVDGLLYMAPEISGVPVGLEAAPFPVVALISEWSVCLETILQIAPFFSYLVIDLPGVEVLKKFGIHNVVNGRVYGFSPRIHHPIPGNEKKYDVSMVGTLNEVLHQRRARYLKRLAMLGDRYKIRFFSGVFGEEYARAVGASKIVFNETIRGEMNMRCYETLACGSLLFLEEDNVEAKQFLKDKIHCVYYNDQNLETLVEYYLSHDQEREAIAQNGCKVIQDYSYTREYARILQTVQGLGLSSQKPLAAMWSEEERAYQRMLLGFHTSEPPSSGILRQNLRFLNPDNPSSMLLIGVAIMEFAEVVPPAEQGAVFTKAIMAFQRGLSVAPRMSRLHFNLAQAYLKLGQNLQARDSFLAAMECGENTPLDDPLFNLLYPMRSAWRLEKEKPLRQNLANSPEHFRVRCLEGLGDTFVNEVDFRQAERRYAEAFSSRMNLTELGMKLGQVREKIGDLTGAISVYEEIWSTRPLFTMAWNRLPKLYAELGEKEKLRAFCEEVLLVVRAFPQLEEMRSEFESWLFTSKH